MISYENIYGATLLSYPHGILSSMARAQSDQCANLTWSAPGDGSDVEREFAVAFALPVQAVPGSVRMVGSPECVQSSNINQFH